MKDLNKLFREVYKDVVSAGIEPGTITEVTVNNRAKQRLGQCRYDGRNYSINISSFILEDGTNVQPVKDTIAHEILHTCKNCMNHGAEWKAQAEVLMAYKPEYNVTRTCNLAEFGIKREAPTIESFRYIYKCEGCGSLVARNRESKFTMNPDRYRCGKCHGKFEMIKRPNDVQILRAACRMR